MKKKIAIGALAASVFLGGFAVLMSMEDETEKPRGPASIVPSNYDSLKACEKQDILWGKVQETAYKDLPEYKKFGLAQIFYMSRQEIQIKGQALTDFAPKGWVKYLHRRGSIAKTKIVPKDSKYTGIFQGADCALLRLSLTYKTEGKRPVAPGLALKVLRDAAPSANVSALVSLYGQEKDFNFFKHPMSNIVPVGTDIGQKLVHRVFKKASDYPEELLVDDMAAVDAHGVRAGAITTPRQIFFVPTGLSFSSGEHEIREDFASIPEGTVIYQIHALSPKHVAFDYANYSDEKAAEFLKDSEHIADVVTTSEFVASDFGDDGIFFRHQLRQ